MTTFFFALAIHLQSAPVPPALSPKPPLCGRVEEVIANDRSVEDLRRGAKRGDATAQFQLGLRYEIGMGVRRDFAQALALYRSAARQQKSRTYVYSPAVGSERYGRVVAIDGRGPPPAAASAAYRLSCLTAKSGRPLEGQNAPRRD